MFVELEPGIDGLIRPADASFKRIESFDEVFKEGDSIRCRDCARRRSDKGTPLHPALMGEQANEAPQKVTPQKSVKAVVTQVEANGLIVRILGVTGWQARGYVPGAATGTQRGTELRKPFPPGKEIEAKILEIDPRRCEVKLSIKAMNEDSERNAYQAYRQQVKRDAKFGTFADLLAKRNEK